MASEEPISVFKSTDQKECTLIHMNHAFKAKQDGFSGAFSKFHTVDTFKGEILSPNIGISFLSEVLYNLGCCNLLILK